MGFLDSVFGDPAQAPTLNQTDYTAAANQGAGYNRSQLSNFENYAPGFTDFIKNLYSSTVNPQATAAQNQQFNLGNQLSTQGYSNAQSNYYNWARQQGLESAAATGAPISGSFANSLGTELSAQNLLNNQLQGTSLLNNYAQNQQSLAQSFMQPGYAFLQSNLVSPTAFMQGAAANNNIQNQNKYIDFANSQQNSFFDNLLGGFGQNLISTPFNLIENANTTAANSPQLFAGMLSKGGFAF